MSKNAYPTILELAEMLRDGGCVMIACMTVASRRVPPGYERDYHCIVCEAELWLSPQATAQIAVGGIPVCFECGLALAEERVRRGRPTELSLSPDAEAAIASGKSSVMAARLDLLRKKMEGL